ncbi:interleukin-6 receptor subunit alpha [Xyrichtys novacula]|uniref:Interleukin-6 receptor subunit alpha n=1 Tax=Xyrichtys novacula TaxID=13765 RepID=A0AAV1FMS3_XYRNO|nr:interleukin-6 receptor subunit alpha [Xyrichtys novacula]
MLIFLPLLFVLCAKPVHSIFDGTCPRKEPPPGLLVVSPGSKLLLTCSGQVKVDGVQVRVASIGPNTSKRRIPSGETPTLVNITKHTGAFIKSDEKYHTNPAEAEENRIITHTHEGYTASPITHKAQKSDVNRLLKDEYNWEERDDEGEEEEEEEEGGEEDRRVTRAVKMMYQWKWNGKSVEKGDRDWEEMVVEERGATLFLSSVRVTDSGKYTCYDKGRQTFSIRVIIADPPETPTLSCYKRSPSSKLRCEWTPRKAITIIPDCYLLLSKRESELFRRIKCSYSPRLSRCWCALDYDEDELRTHHRAYLCVTSIAGNTTSNLKHFTPLGILQPEPPSHVTVQQETGQETRLKVIWTYPKSWKSQDSHYELKYEIKYRPRMSSSIYEQRHTIKKNQHFTITDAMPGVEYVIQLRATEEFDGLWSDWSLPVNACSWTAPSESPLTTTMFPPYPEGSGADVDVMEVGDPVPSEPELSYHFLWISGLFALLSVTLAVYIFRHKDRFTSKLQRLSVVFQCDLPQPQTSASAPPEEQDEGSFDPLHYQEPSSSDVEEEQGEEEDELEQWPNNRMIAQHFNNTTYFFLQKE